MTACILIPSRGRFGLLLRAIRSLHDTADKAMFEVRVKFDDDDSGSINRIKELDQFGNVTTLVASRRGGYASLDWYCSQMADSSPAKWIMIFNDDAVISCGNWEEQLRSIPTSGFIVQPEVYQLNQSKYPNCEGGAFPFVPNGCWKDKGWAHISCPSDTQFDRLLRIENGWKTHFLTGVTIAHHRTGTVPA